jgi:PAS domain S-box-containing protein
VSVAGAALGAALPGDGSPLRILMVEDVETDAELVLAALRRAQLAFTARRCETAADFVRLLEEFDPHVVLADYSLPQFSALDALALLREQRVRLPFVLVTGTQTEEIAVQCIKEGADDYVLKERLARLPAAVSRAIQTHRTEREKEHAEDALRSSEERYRLIAENTRDLICLLDPNGAVLYVSPSCRELLRYEPAELATAADLWRMPDDAVGRPMGILRLALVDGGANEVQCRHRDGDWRTFEAVGSWVRGDDGGVQHAVVVLRDVTDRKRAEERLREAQLQLIQAEKMESVGRLAAGVAHEVKNPLTVILMGVEYLRQRFDQFEPEVVTLLEDMEASTRKANTVVRGLLDFSTPGTLDRLPVALNSIVEGALALMRHEFARAQTEVVVDLADDLPALELDRHKIEQVFVNLFLNALQSMPEGGRLTVRTWRADENGRRSRAVCAQVEDTGGGIQPDKISKIFDPFFTTKPLGRGTGLGLTVVKKIIDLHGATIAVSNKQTGGVVVSLVFRTGPGE